MATAMNVKTKPTKIIHAFGGMGFSYCGKKVSTKNASGDPAETDYQKGYLAAALDLYREGIGRGGGDDRLTILDAQVRA